MLLPSLVSHGVVVIQPWVVKNPAENYETEWVMEILQWSREHLQDKLHGSGLDRGLELDFDNVIIAGHSSGAHVEVEFLKHYCDTVKGQILFSPVDGVDPFGLIHDFAITPGQVNELTTSPEMLSTFVRSVCQLRPTDPDADGRTGQCPGWPRWRPHPALCARGPRQHEVL